MTPARSTYPIWRRHRLRGWRGAAGGGRDGGGVPVWLALESSTLRASWHWDAAAGTDHPAPAPWLSWKHDQSAHFAPP